MIHHLPLEARTVHGFFSRELRPVLTVRPGDTVHFQSLNAGWRWDPTEELFDRDKQVHDGHALNGPIEVRGALAGHTLAVRIDDLQPRDWGVTFGDGTPFGWSIRDGEALDERGKRVALAPFLGVIGMPPPERGIHSTIPPRRWGGNIDCKDLVAGTTLYLPVPVDGALLSVGDGHAAQGHGEVSGTAIESPLEHGRVTIDVRDDLELRSPIARTADAWLAFGFNSDLDAAAEQATETMLDLMERELGVDRAHALALASVAVDLHVTQVVNRAKGVHAVLRDGAIR